MSFLKKSLPYLVLAAAVFAAYANVYSNAFLFDDEQFILDNALLRSWHSLGAIFISSGTAGAGIQDLYYRPLQTLLYLILYQTFGLSTAAFHALNVILHAANAGLIYALGRRLDFKPIAVFLAALIWALHPLQTEAVTYMSSTVDPLYVFFCLCGLLVMLPDFSKRKIAFACPFYLLALLSKETAIIFPLLAASCLFLLDRKRLNAKTYRRLWPLVVTAALYLVGRHFALGGGYDFYKQSNIYTEHISYRIYTFLATLPAYAKLLIWPFGLHMDRNFPVYPDPWHADVIGGALMVLLALGQIIGGKGRRGLPLSWGFLWFASAHALNTGIVLPINGFFFEHWMYWPTVGLFLGAAQNFALWLKAKNLNESIGTPVAIIAAVAALALGVRTSDQNTVWRDPITFYSYTIAQGAKSARVHNNLANAYMDRGDLPDGIKELRAAIKISDAYPQTHHNLALALIALPDRDAHLDEAMIELRRATDIDSNFFQSYELLGNIYDYRGDPWHADLYHGRATEIRKKLGIPAEEYAQPKLVPTH
jgi:tetratricopeptide (TPR) repeat protein